MKKFLYRLLLTLVVIMALLSTVSAITNLHFFEFYPFNQARSSHTSLDYSFRSIEFDFKTEAIATFKSNNDEQKIAI